MILNFIFNNETEKMSKLHFSKHIFFHDSGVPEKVEHRLVVEEQDSNDGLLHGEQLEYYTNGNIKSKRYFNRGAPNKTHYYFFEDGSLQEVIPFADGSLHGLFQSYYSNGVLQIQKNFIYGKLNGKVMERWENGKYRKKEYYRNDIPVFTHYAYYEDGSLYEKIQYKNGKMHGKCFLLYKDGSCFEEHHYYKGKLHGRCTRFFKNRQIECIRYFHFGKHVGLYKEYYANGILKQKIRFNKRGEKNGLVQMYNENNQVVFISQFKNNKKDGVQIFFYPNGSIRSIRNFNNGNLHGETIQFSSIGSIEASYTYINNCKEGVFLKKNNNETIIGNYRNGRKNGYETHATDKEVTRVLFYKNGRKHGLQKYFIEDEKEEFFCQGKKLLSLGIKRDTCSVCWEETKYQTSCSHYICLECIQKMGRQQCPMCRHSL